MKWSLVFCLLLASTALARPRTKRTIGHLKSLIFNKLFGIGGKTVIVARPILSNNETYQLFRIPGIDDFLVKVSKNDKKLEKDEVIYKPTQEIKDPVIVKPEVAIIGSYLGTTTQKETLLAIEMVKNLVRSGILTGRLDSSMQELLIPQGFGGYIEEGVLTQPMHVITEEERHIYTPEYPEFFVPPELKLTTPISITPNSKYYYKQEGTDADMTYESHDNKDVFVTRTEKQTKQTQNNQVSDAAKNVGNNKNVSIGQPLRINGPRSPYHVNQGIKAGLIPIPNQNPLYNINQGISGNMPEKGQNPPPPFHVNQGTMSGNMPGQGQNPIPGYYVNQGIISGQGKHPPTYYFNQGIATGGILGQVPYGAPTYNEHSGMITSAQGHVGNAPLMNNLNQSNVPGKGQNPPPGYFANQGMISGNMPGQGQNPTPGYYVDQGIISEQGKHPSTYYFNQGFATGGILEQVPYIAPTYNEHPGMIGSAQGLVGNAPLMNNLNQSNVPGKGQIPPPGYFANQGMISGNMPGQGLNPTPGYYVDQGIIFEQGKHPPNYYVNQGIATGGILGQVPYGAPTYNEHSGMIGSAQGHVGNAPLMNNLNPNVMAGYYGPGHSSSVYYINPGAVGGNPGQIPQFLSHGLVKPINVIGQQFIGNDVNGGVIVTDGNPSLQSEAFVHPFYFGNNAQGVIICKEKQGKACKDKTDKITLNPTQNISKPAVNQQSASFINNTIGNAKKNIVKEFVNNHTVNGQIVAKYSYQQINSHSNKNFTEVKLSETSAVETNKDLNKEFVYIPPGDSSIALSLKKEGQNGNNYKNAFTSNVNVKTNKEEIKRFMAPNRLKSNMSNFKQNPIVVAEKRSNEADEKLTKPDYTNNGEIPGSTY